MHGHAIPSMDDIFSIQQIVIIFQEAKCKWDFQFNQHFLVINIHGSHDMLEAVE